MKSTIVASFSLYNIDWTWLLFFFNVSKLLTAIQQLRFINYVRTVNEKHNNDEIWFWFNLHYFFEWLRLTMVWKKFKRKELNNNPSTLYLYNILFPNHKQF